MQVVHVRDVDIAHEVVGSGVPLFMIQGLGYDHVPFTWLRDALSASFRTIVFDNRGVGGSSVPPGPYTIEGMADDVTGLMDALGIDRAHVLGVSLGGYVAQMLALSHPDRVLRMVLGCTCMTGDPERMMMPRATLDLLLDREGTPEQIARRGLAVAFSESFPPRSPDIMDALVRHRVTHPVTLEGYRAQLSAGMEFDVTDRVSRISCPVLVLHGDLDAVVPVDRGRELASAIPGARLEVQPGAGHLFFIEEADRTADLVTSFLGGAH